MRVSRRDTHTPPAVTSAPGRGGRARRGLSALCLASLLLLAACDGGTQSTNSNAGASADGNVKTGVKPEPDAEAAVIQFEDPAYGQIVIELYPNIAPQMVGRFKTLAREGFYNGTAIHRVEPPTSVTPGGVIQGGDPNTKDDDYANDGQGQSDYPDLQPEYSDIPYELGTVGAADAGPGTANSQFFISLGRNERWDRKYTVFGRVIRGVNEAKIVSNAPRRVGTTNPEPKVVIKSITLQPRASF